LIDCVYTVEKLIASMQVWLSVCLSVLINNEVVIMFTKMFISCPVCIQLDTG
jgi:hypothetical protein